MKSKKKVIALVTMLGAAVIGGTFAYFNQTLTATNMFDTGTYDTELVEKFKPTDGENWEPGTNVNKDVTVKNTGSLPVVVRVKFEEEWVNRDSKDVLYKMDTTVNKDKLAVGTPSNASNKFENVYQGDDGDGKTGIDADDSVVFKQMIPNGGWVYNPTDGYYYYTKKLVGVKKESDGTEVVDETTKLLDGVTLAETTDMGAFKEMKFYATTEDRPEDDSKDWIEFATESDATAVDGYKYYSTRKMSEQVKENGGFITYMKSITALKSPELSGYSNADYTLTVTAQTVQATDVAVQSCFKEDTLAHLFELGCEWADPDRSAENGGLVKESEIHE